MQDTTYDVIFVGSGFASTFWMVEYLRRAPESARVLMLERGPRVTHEWQLRNRRHSPIKDEDTFRQEGAPKKWRFNIGFGGGSNCWAACTPRMMPNDFRLATVYGVGRDWPIGYDELEPYYEDAEEILSVSGTKGPAPYPRRKPHPQPPHRFSDVDRMMKAKFGDLWVEQPTARARLATATRPACCGNGVCTLCPINAKFTIAGDLPHLFADPRVTLLCDAEVFAVETEGGLARSVRWRSDGAEHVARASLVVVGANAIFTPHLLKRSGIDHPLLGRRLHEQVSLDVTLHLSGVRNFNGSTSITGHGYMLYDGPHRARHAAALIEHHNAPPALRMEKGRWRETARLKFIFEELPLDESRVLFDPSDPARPVVRHGGHSDYALAGMAALRETLPRLLEGLPVEEIIYHDINRTESHVQGTTVMGRTIRDSVVDDALRMHQCPNLVLAGSGAFPTGSPANPTLTLCALSLRSARKLMGGA